MSCWILIYDSRCEVCAASALALQKVDRTSLFRPLPLDELSLAGNAELLEKLPELPQIAAQELTLISPDYRVFQGAVAIEKIIELLPLARPIRWLLERVAGRSTGAYSLMRSIRRRCKKCP